MGRVVLLLVAGIAAALIMTNRVSLSSLDPRSVGTTVDGRHVIRSAQQVEGRFTRLAPVDETYMLFGGDARQRKNQLTHAHLAGLALPYARSIASRYPDFHLCRSGGAAEAKRLVEPMDMVAADRSTRATLGRALDLFEDRLRSGGDRTCLRIRGAELSLDSVRVPSEDLDLSDQMLPAFAKSRFVLVEEAAIEDCAMLLQ